MKPTLTIAALLLAGSAHAATLTETDGTGINAPFTVTAERSGLPGTGRMADTPILRSGLDGDEVWRGRYNPYGDGTGDWYGSGDNSVFTLDFTFDRPTDRLHFAVTDMADIPAGSWVYDVQFRDGTQIETYLTGAFTVTAEVTP
jgi:hypothetical protein